MRNLCISLLALSSLAQAQVQTVVSPVANNGVEGSQANAFPWTSATPKHYMQIHSDIGGTPKVITKIAGRPNGNTTGFTGTRSLDIEVYMGDSVPYNSCSFVIANNYIGARSAVLTRQVVNCGPFTAGTPAPFEFGIPLTTPYVYSGANSLAWEMLQYANTATGTAPSSTDTENSSLATATSTVTGTGCIASGQTAAMIHTVTAADVAGLFTFGFYVDRAPANAPTVLYIGASNPNLSVFGLCGNLYTDLLISLPLGQSDANGYIGSLSGTTKIAGGPCTILVPNTFPGATVYTQVHSIDVGSTSLLPIANSDGRATVVPTPTLTKVTKVSRIFSNGATTDVNAHFFNTTSVGYGAVVEFTY